MLTILELTCTQMSLVKRILSTEFIRQEKFNALCLQYKLIELIRKHYPFLNFCDMEVDLRLVCKMSNSNCCCK